MSIRMKSFLLLLLVSTLFVISACSQDIKEEGTAAVSSNPASGSTTEVEPTEGSILDTTEEAELDMFVYKVTLTQPEFEQFMQTPVLEKYPHITLNLLEKDLTLEELVAAGSVPDMVFTGPDFLASIRQMDYPKDLTELVKKANMDLTRIDPFTINRVNVDGKLHGMPFGKNLGVMFYNKDIFDHFALDYPHDEMTWEEVIDYHRKITRVEDGVHYIGWAPGFPDAIASTFAIPFADAETKMANINNDVYQRVFTLMREAYETPGFKNENNKFNYGWSQFVGDHTVGMLTEWSNKLIGRLEEAEINGTAPNWDMASIPNFEENVGKSREVFMNMFTVAQTTEYENQAMQVIEVLTSDEVQMMQSQMGRLSVLLDPEIENQFGTKTVSLQGKNVDALFKPQPVASPPGTIYDSEVKTVIRQLRRQVIDSNENINTLLQRAEEQANQIIAEMNQ